MKRIIFATTIVISSLLIYTHQIQAVYNIDIDSGPRPCLGSATCITEIETAIYNNGAAPGVNPPPPPNDPLRRPYHDYYGQTCAASYEDFLLEPATKHYWVEDQEITSQGKADERARQFIYWVLNNQAIDNHQTLKTIWDTSRNISYFMVLIAATFIGLGFIVSQRTNFNLKIKVWPSVWKIAIALLYITFSYSIVLLLIQVSEIIMKFFIESTGGDKLFNIYFTSSVSSENNYTSFYGCRDLNLGAQEGAEAELMMLRFTNITYYVMGSMLLLRKILLWFLLFVSPFLAILMPFTFIRNTGWIWIGVFFQWLFYGPLFAMFLGALTIIWKNGIPFGFDFSRVNSPDGYVYPTATLILYGGPAQTLGLLNNANYIDTFVEYILSLLMLWAVTFFPWWLLRIFRDYCCDVFAAANNVLLSMYDQMRAGPPGLPPTAPAPAPPPRTPTGLSQTIPSDKSPRPDRPMVVRLENLTEIKAAKTNDIVNNLSLNAPRLADIARYETNKESRDVVQKNLEYLANPTKAQTPAERQTFMNLRTELFSRAVKEDKLAQQIISSTSNSYVDRLQRQSEVLKTLPQATPIAQAVSSNTQVANEKVQSITNNYFNSIANNSQAVSNISQATNTSESQVKSILQNYANNTSQSSNQAVNTVAQNTNSTKEQVSEVLKQAMNMTQSSNIANETVVKEKVSNETVQKILQSLPQSFEQRQTQTQSMNQSLSQSIQMPQERTQSISNNMISSIANNNDITSAIAQSTNLSQQQVKQVLSSFSQNMNQSASEMINSVASQTNVTKEKAAEVLQQTYEAARQSSVVRETAQSEKISQQTAEKILQSIPQSIQSSVSLAQSLSLETKVPQSQVSSITNSLVNNITTNNQTLSQIAQSSNMSQSQVQSILQSYANNSSVPASELISTIARETNTTKEQTTQVLEKANSFMQQSSVASEVAEKEKVEASNVEKIAEKLSETIIRQAPAETPVNTYISSQSHVSQQNAQNITNSLLSQVTNNQKMVEQIQSQTGVSSSQIQSIVNSFAQNTNQSTQSAISQISQQTGVSKEKVHDVLQQTTSMISSSSEITDKTAQSTSSSKSDVSAVSQSLKETLSEKVSQSNFSQVASQANLTTDKAMSVTSSLLNSVINNTSTMQNLQQQTGLSNTQIQNALNTYIQNVDQTPAVIADRIHQAAGIDKDQVVPKMKQVMSTLANNSVLPQEVVEDIAKKEQVSAEQVRKVVQAQMPMVTAPDKQVEKTIAIPASISLEDYEEVKKMWTQQYEKGEVPITENLTNREQWVDQDTVMITNTLNKLLSNDDKVRRQGLEDLGFILPVFMINNLKGDELLVYLKAKLEAAKAVKGQIEHEKEVVVKIQAETAQPEEVYVEATRTEAAPKVMHMEMEQEIEQPESTLSDMGFRSADTSESSIGDAFTTSSATQRAPFIVNISEIKNIKTTDLLRSFSMVAEKLTDIARIETNRDTRETVQKHIEYLAQPDKASSDAERQSYMGLRTELSTRAESADQTAQQLVTPTKDYILQSVPQPTPVTQVVSTLVNLPQEKVQSITSSAVNAVSQNSAVIQSISEQTQIPQSTVQTVFNTYTQSMGVPTPQVVQSISEKTSVSKEKVTEILRTVENLVQTSRMPETIASTHQLPIENVHSTLQTMASAVEVHDKPVVEEVEKATNVSSQTVSTITQALLSYISNTPSMIQYIQSQTGLEKNQVQTAISTITQNLNQPANTTIQQLAQQLQVTPVKAAETFESVSRVMQSENTVRSIAESTKTEEETVKKIVESVSTIASTSVAEATPVAQQISEKANISTQQAQSVISSIVNTAVTNPPLMQSIQKETGMQEQQVKNILTTYAQNTNESLPVLTERVAAAAGVEKTKVGPALQSAMKQINANVKGSHEMLKEVAEKEGVSETQVAEVLGAQMPMMTAPQENVEKTVPIPAGVSIEDYEEVKTMWTQQYEKGEVPMGTGVSNREGWVDQDIVMLTNVMNKLYSSDEAVRRQALDEVGFLLPVFMVNNLSGEELLVYLKAKLEAAKAVKKDLVKQVESAAQQAAQTEDIFVEATTTPATASKTLHMELEEEQPTATASTPSLSRSETEYEETQSVERTSTTPPAAPFVLNLSEIKSVTTTELLRSLNMVAEKLTDIARIETNHDNRQTIEKHIEYLSEPSKASSAEEQQTYRDIKTELASRADASDHTAQQLISPARDSFLKTVPQQAPISQVISAIASTPAEKGTHEQPMAKEITQQTSLPAQTVDTVTQSIFSYVSNSPSTVEYIQNQTGLPAEQIQAIITSFTQNVGSPTNVTINQIAQQTGLAPKQVAETFDMVCYLAKAPSAIASIAQSAKAEERHVEQVVDSLTAIARDTAAEFAPVSQAIATETHIKPEQAESVITSLINTAIADDSLIQEIQKQTGLSVSQIKNMLTSYVENITQPTPLIIDRIAEATTLDQTQVLPKLGTTLKIIQANIVRAQGLIKEIATRETMTEVQVIAIFEAQLPIMTEPEKNIEKAVPIPQDISLEDYEEVKTMWTQQYEKGEVPTGEGIDSRESWIDHDIVALTNILNKLFSSDENIRKGALDEIGLLLPIFMVNNLSGHELLVYLKAKLEAAKAVRKALEQAKEVRKQVEAETETETVEVPAPSPAGAEKTMAAEAEVKPESNTSLEDIKSKLGNLSQDSENNEKS